MKKVLLTISLLFSFSVLATDWVSSLLAGNQNILSKIQWKKIQKLDKRKTSQTIAIIGGGIIPQDFTEMIDINSKEIPDNGIDDDKNGYVDDYHGMNFSLGHGTDYGDYDGTHEIKVASAIAMITNFHKGQKHPIKIIPLTIQDYSTSFDFLYFKKIAEAIDYAVMRKARIINISLGVSESYKDFFQFVDNDYNKSLKYLTDAIERAKQNGTIILSSSSNDNNRFQNVEKDYPSDLKHIVSVTGVNILNEIKHAHGSIIMTAFYSENILLYEGDGKFARDFGTSFATPMVASFVALLMAKKPDLTVDEIRSKISSASTGRINGWRKIRRGVFVPHVFLNL